VVTGLPSELEIKKIIVEDNKEIGKQEKAPEVAPAVEEPKAEKAPEVAPAVEEPKAEKAPEAAPAVEEPKEKKAPEVAPVAEEPKQEKAPEVAPVAEEPKQEKAPEEAPVVEEPKQEKKKKQSEAVLLDAEDIENGEEIIDAQLAELRKLESEGKFIELIQLTSDVMRNAVKGEGKVKEENTKKNEALYPFISDYFEGGLGYGVRAIKEEKQESFEKLLEAMGYEIARNCVLVGKEITETAEKIKNGEIKGAEEFAHDPKACINIASSYVFESGSDANFNMTTPTNAFFQLFLNTDVKSSRLAGELLNKGNQTYLDSIKDENERAKAKELLELGVSAGESKISKYGLKCAYADEKKEKICIVSAEEKFAEKLKDLSSKELQKEEDKLTKIYEQSKQVKDLIPKVIKGIGENLDFLDKTNRDSHENSDEFDNMTSAMLDLYKSDTKQLTIHTFAKKVKQVRDAAAEYERTHDKWNKAFWKTGKDRLEMSKHIKEMTDLTLQAIGEVKKGGYFDEPLKGVTSILEGDIRLVGEKREKQEEKERALKDGEANNKQRRKLDIKEVRDMLKGDKKTESKRNSINKAAQKDSEIKNDTIKKSNTFTGKKN
ncbi:MAG: hypothetical protein K6F97_07540, partial [Lachnospiraceae bacterium]|nr:hypothetical protein [Lachnospiraceae bacterium]